MTTVALCLDLLDEMELWIDACNERITECKENKYWNISAVPNKGYGMVTKTDIKTDIKDYLNENIHQTAIETNQCINCYWMISINYHSMNKRLCCAFNQPNCTMHFKSFPAEVRIVRTLFDIKQNTQLTVSYLPRFKMAYHERQRLLTKRYKFRCE
eukprot:817752_1